MPRIEVALIDSNGQLDTFKAYPDEFIDDVMSAKVDSMANDYYIKTIFNLDSISNPVFSEDNLVRVILSILTLVWQMILLIH
jgi:hypothetical protein